MKNSNTSNTDLSKEYYERRNRNRLMIAVFPVIFLPFLFYFFAQSITIRISPELANQTAVQESSEGVTFQFGEYWVLLSPSALITVNAEGFEEANQPLARSSNSSIIELEMIPKKGIVNLSFKLPGSYEVYLNQVRQVPEGERLVLELSKGSVDLLVKGSLFGQIKETLEVQGYGNIQNYVIEGEVAKGSITFSLTQDHVDVFLDGVAQARSSGNGNDSLDVLPGPHTISFSADDYQTKKFSIEALKNGNVDLGPIALTPNLTRLILSSEPNVSLVRVNGKIAGATPIELMLKPSTAYDLEITQAGYEKQTLTLRPQIGKDLSKHVELEAAPLFARVDANVEAEVSLNGFKVGLTPLKLNVQKGDRLALSAAGFTSQDVIVNAAHEADLLYSFTLWKEDQHNFQVAPDSIIVEGIQLLKIEGQSVMRPSPDGSEAARRMFRVDGFYAGTREISEGVFSRIMNSGNAPSNATLPVTNISWMDAIEFCNRLSDRAGLEKAYHFRNDRVGKIAVTFRENAAGFRLPTHAEWLVLTGTGKKNELATRVSPLRLSDQVDLPLGIGNLSGRENAGTSQAYLGSYLDQHVELAPVGSYLPNSLGIHGLYGNVSEWLHNYASSGVLLLSADENINHFGPQSGMENLVSGANYKTHQTSELSPYELRKRLFPSKHVGFRIVRGIP